MLVNRLSMVLRFYVVVVCVFASSVYTHADDIEAGVSKQNADFRNWLSDLRLEAEGKGISKKTIDEALANVVFKQRVIKSDRSQAEFKETYDDYIRKRVSDWRVNKGREYMDMHHQHIRRVVQQYGVPMHVVVAIIGVETNYGSFELTHSMFDVLATLAFDKRRGARFRKEIFAALEILDKGYATVDLLKSSWAGAMGVPQFMPTTYLQFAQDFDGDGRKDIWHHGPDLYASVANYLSHYGWDDSKTWARKVVLPLGKLKSLSSTRENVDKPSAHCKRYNKHLFGWRVLDKWHEDGVRRMNGGVLPKVNIPAALIVTDAQSHFGYLVYGNFCSLMRYNPSFKYALSVGVLSDAIKMRK